MLYSFDKNKNGTCINNECKANSINQIVLGAYTPFENAT